MDRFLLKKEAADPFAFMRRITGELDRALGMRGEMPGLPEAYPRMWAPEIEIFERDQKYFVRVDLPGLKKEDVKLELAHDHLTIEGERKVEKEQKEEGFHRTERTYGMFYRTVPIPEHVKAEDATAVFRNGVLEIVMPAIPVPELKKRTLEIKG